MAGEDDWMTDGKDHTVLLARSDEWVRSNAGRLTERFRTLRAQPDLQNAIMERLLPLGDPESTRLILLTSPGHRLLKLANPEVSADILLSIPKGTDSLDYSTAVHVAAGIPTIRLLPLWAECLKSGPLLRWPTLAATIEAVDHLDGYRLLLDFLAGPDGPWTTGFAMESSKNLRIQAGRLLLAKALDSARRGEDFPPEHRDILAAARKNAKGREACALTMVSVALGRADGLEALEPAFPGFQWDQEQWLDLLCRSRQEEVLRFVARMVAAEKMFLTKVLGINPGLEPRIREAVEALPDDARRQRLLRLLAGDPAEVREENRRHDEMNPRAPLPIPANVDGLQKALACARCGHAAGSVAMSPEGFTYSGPFIQSGLLDRTQSLDLLNALRSGTPDGILRALGNRWAHPCRKIDPVCPDCNKPYCKACWSTEDAGESGGSDIGVWYRDTRATCPRGHAHIFSIVTRSYG